MGRQRVAMVFVTHAEGEVLLVRRPVRASTYPGRLTTVSGPVLPDEAPDMAAMRALRVELGPEVAAGASLAASGLPLDFADTIKRQTVVFRLHPFLFRLAVPAVRALAGLVDARWVEPDAVIVAAATAETVPELDEALARVWDPPSALPPPFRDEARSLVQDRTSSTEALVSRVVAMVAGGAPPERVAALRPSRARLVNAARAAVRPSRDVPDEVHRARRGAARDLGAEIHAGARVFAVGAPAGLEPDRHLIVDEIGEADLVIIAAEAVTEAYDVIAPHGALVAARAAAACGIPVVVAADPWAIWPDVVPPPLEHGLELVPHSLITRTSGLRV